MTSYRLDELFEQCSNFLQLDLYSLLVNFSYELGGGGGGGVRKIIISHFMSRFMLFSTLGTVGIYIQYILCLVFAL